MNRKYIISEAAKQKSTGDICIYHITKIFRLYVQPPQSGSSNPKVRVIMFTSIPKLYAHESYPVMFCFFIQHCYKFWLFTSGIIK